MPAASNKSEKSNGARNDNIEFGVLPDLIGYQLRRAQLMFFQHFAATLGEKKITPGQLGLLVLISENPGISQSALAKAAGIERSTLGEVVSAMEKSGLVIRERMERDRRTHAVSLSRKGRQTLTEILPLVRRHEIAAASNLDAKERRQLLTLLRRLAS
ncbi:MAG: MarR family winged helix-turn-helix transcriptional regulator [Sphingomonadales bacterium]